MGKYDKKPASRAEAKAAARGAHPELNSNPEYQQIAAWLSSVKFQKKAVSGLDPADVWKKIEELNGLYENALLAERVRYNLLLRQVMASRAPAAPEETDG